MKAKKKVPIQKSALCSGQQLLSGYFSKNLKQASRSDVNDEKKSASTLVHDSVDLSDDDIVPPTQRQEVQAPAFSKCAFSSTSRPLRVRSSPLKHPSRGPSARIGPTARPPKRKLEDDTDSCASVAAKPLSSIQTSKALTSIRTPLHSPQVFKRKENIPQKEPQVFLEESKEKWTAKEAHSSVAIGDNDLTWFDLDSGKDLDFVDDWGMDDIGLEHESCYIDAKASPIFQSVKGTLKAIDKTTPGCVRLTMEKVDSKEELTCILKGSWQNEKLNVGDMVYLHAKFRGNCTTVESDDGLIIVHPDILVNSTTIVSSLFCTRKSVLATKFRDIDSSNLSMLIGSIAHELFQKALAGKASKDVMVEIVNTLLQRSDILHDMYSLKANEGEVREQLLKLLPNIRQWMAEYMSTRLSANPKIGLSVTEVRDIEDNYWCPRLGVKGKVDATLEVKVHDRQRLLPLELKTGRHTFSAEHKGQVILYTLMMAERQATDVDEGLLLYIRDGVDMQKVASRHAERRDLVQRRNELAAHLASAACVLPDPLDSERFCPKCPYSTTCSIYRRSSGEEMRLQAEKRPEPQFVEESVKHLTSKHMQYFMEWCAMLDTEMQHAKHDLQDCFWVEDAVKRESKGLCFSNMELATSQGNGALNARGQAVFQHTFRRKTHNEHPTDVPPPPLGSLARCCGLAVGDRVTVSEQDSLTCVALALGSVVAVTDDEVTLHLERDMHFHREWQAKTFRIDKAHSAAAFTISYSNLAKLMSTEPVSAKLRSLVIDRALPCYRKTLAKETAVACHGVLKPLNNFQRRAVLKFLMSDDYVLFKGLPGTGKTTTIAALIQALVLLKKRVLLTSYTHSGVDSVLLKLKSRGVPFVRLGATDRAHPAVKEFSAGNLTASIKTLQELQEFYESQPVVACTCLGSGQGVLQRLRFDACIVDEASQALQPSCLGPLFLARSFVLVGDTQQLPPVVQSSEARNKGMDVSLFARLEHPDNTMVLPVQYRMNREITAVCNGLTYAGQLQCGSEDVANASLSLPNLSKTLGQVLPADSWMLKAVSGELDRAVVFVCTDALATSEGDYCNNSRGSNSSGDEARIVRQLVHVLIKAGVPPEEVGVIAPFRNQVRLLKQECSSVPQVDVSTVDQFQGKEKSVVLFSCVKKYTGDSKDAEILNDQRRLTVAVSRAKHKLIIIGSSSTVKKYKPFEKLLSLLREDQFIKLQAGDESCYEEIVLQA